MQTVHVISVLAQCTALISVCEHLLDPILVEEQIMQNKLVAKVTQCPQCEVEVPRVPHPKELAELVEDARIRTIKAEKTSYWRQFEQGMLGRDAVLVLNSIADSAMDTQER